MKWSYCYAGLLMIALSLGMGIRDYLNTGTGFLFFIIMSCGLWLACLFLITELKKENEREH